MQNDDWNKICRRIPFEDGRLRSANPNVKALSPAQAQQMYAPPAQKQETPQLTIQERLDKQRQENIKQNDAAFSAANKQPISVDPNTMHWPPVNPYAKEGEKDLEVVYTTEKVQGSAVMTLEEAEEFATNLWEENNGKDSTGLVKNIWVAGDQATKAYRLAEGLGGLGVVAKTKVTNGKEYVIISNYRKHLKTLVKGHRWRANNPQVVEFGIGAKNMARGMLTVTKFDIIFAGAMNAVDVYVHDEKTMVDFFGNTGADIAKGMIATGVGTVFGLGAFAVTGGMIVAGGVAFAVFTFFASLTVDGIDKEYKLSEQVVDKLKELVEE